MLRTAIGIFENRSHDYDPQHVYVAFNVVVVQIISSVGNDTSTGINHPILYNSLFQITFSNKSDENTIVKM